MNREKFSFRLTWLNNAVFSRFNYIRRSTSRHFIGFDETGVTFPYKDYRRNGADRQQVMTLSTDESIRRFLLHVLPRGFHHIRHYGLLLGTSRKASLDRARKLLSVAHEPEDDEPEVSDARPLCPCGGGHMVIIASFARWQQPRAPSNCAASTRETAPGPGMACSIIWPPCNGVGQWER